MGWMVYTTPLQLYVREREPVQNCTGDAVGRRAVLDECGEYRPPPGFDPRTAQPVASSYTD